MTISNKTDIHYRYFDATKQAEYLFKTVEAAIDYELKKGLEFVKAYEPMKAELDENLNLSDKDMGNVIRFCLQGNGNISKGKIKRYLSHISNDDISEAERLISDHMRLFINVKEKKRDMS